MFVISEASGAAHRVRVSSVSCFPLPSERAALSLAMSTARERGLPPALRRLLARLRECGAGERIALASDPLTVASLLSSLAEHYLVHLVALPNALLVTLHLPCCPLWSVADVLFEPMIALTDSGLKWREVSAAQRLSSGGVLLGSEAGVELGRVSRCAGSGAIVSGPPGCKGRIAGYGLGSTAFVAYAPSGSLELSADKELSALKVLAR